MIARGISSIVPIRCHGVWVPASAGTTMDFGGSGSPTIHLCAIKLSPHHATRYLEGDDMERRRFLKIAVGVAAGAAALGAAAQAAPLMPHPLQDPQLPPGSPEVRPAVTTVEEVDRLKPEEVRWGRHWHRRHWGWRRRHWGWRRRHWGWGHRRWHRRHWW
jgi:hypothetical protein